MMLNKEECEKALDILKEQLDYLRFNMQSNYPYTISMIKNVINCFSKLIEEHFELIENYEKLDTSDTSKEECTIEQYLEIKELRNELKNLKNPQPYKLSDLKPNMWVWDDKEKRCSCVDSFAGRCQIYFLDYTVDFEENRFYPVTKVLQYQVGVD